MSKKGYVRKDNRQINVRISELEYLELKKRADGEMLSISKYLKREVLGFKDKRSKSSEKNRVYSRVSRADIVLLANEMRRIGVNINQIAKHLNTSNILDFDGSYNINEDLKEQLADVKGVMIKIWQLLS